MPKPKSSMSEQFGELIGLAALMPICVVIGYFVGQFLDGKFGTTYLTVIFLLLGAAAGIISLIREIQKMTKKNG